MFDDISGDEAVTILLFAGLVLVGIIAPVLALAGRWSQHLHSVGPCFPAESDARRCDRVAWDLVSGRPLGGHRATMEIGLTPGVSAIVEVNAATCAGIGHRGTRTFLSGLRDLTKKLEREGLIIVVRLADGRSLRVRPPDWYRLLAGPSDQFADPPGLPRPALPEWTGSIPRVTAPPPPPALPESAEDADGEPSVEDIPKGFTVTEPYEEFIVTFRDEECYEEVVVTHL